MTEDEILAFQVFSQKGPRVNCEDCQKEAAAAFMKIDKFLLKSEIVDLELAGKRARAGHGRFSFDHVMSKVLTRLEVKFEDVPRGPRHLNDPWWDLNECKDKK
jgi:hypothetical protein